MASARRKPATVALDEQRVEVELQALRQRLVEEGAAKLSAIKPKALRERVVAVLAAEGFEATSTWLRKPLAAQLDAALAHGAVLPRKVLGAHLRGATAAELQRALEAAERAGRVRRVLRGKAESLAGSSATLLSAQQLGRLSASVSALNKALAQVTRKKGLGLLLGDVQQVLDDAVQLVRSASTPGAAQPHQPLSAAASTASEATGSNEAALRSTLEALGAVRDTDTGLSYVPDVVRRLSPVVPVAVARDMLLLAARRELVELRPEGGLGRLSAAELELCPPGPAGARLSWARLLVGAQS